MSLKFFSLSNYFSVCFFQVVSLFLKSPKFKFDVLKIIDNTAVSIPRTDEQRSVHLLNSQTYF